MARVVIESKVRARRLRRRALATLAVILLLLAVFGAAVGLAHLPALRIVQVTVAAAPGESLSADQAQLIHDYAAQELSGDYLLLFPRDNALLYPKSAIVQGLLKNFPALMSAAAGRSGWHTLSVVVGVREPVALWCGAVAASSSPCFLLDAHGLAYAALSISGNTFDRYFGALTGDANPRQYLSPQSFASLMALVAALKEVDASGVSSVSVDENNDVTVSFGDGFRLLFALADTDTTLQRFALARRADVFMQHPLSDFEYLDLRFGDKLYYKLKNQ